MLFEKMGMSNRNEDGGFSYFKNIFEEFNSSNPFNNKYTGIIYLRQIMTPLGSMVAGASEAGLCLLEFTDRRMLKTELKDLMKLLKSNYSFDLHPLLPVVEQQIKEYFNRERKSFDIPLDTPGTDFQKLVWDKLREIPYGQTRSYKQQAIAVGNPAAVRAVAGANGNNRVSIIIPCHRVIGDDGKLVGYGGGLRRKKALLELEKAASIRYQVSGQNYLLNL